MCGSIPGEEVHQIKWLGMKLVGRLCLTCIRAMHFIWKHDQNVNGFLEIHITCCCVSVSFVFTLMKFRGITFQTSVHNQEYLRTQQGFWECFLHQIVQRVLVLESSYPINSVDPWDTPGSKSNLSPEDKHSYPQKLFQALCSYVYKYHGKELGFPFLRWYFVGQNYLLKKNPLISHRFLKGDFSEYFDSTFAWKPSKGSWFRTPDNFDCLVWGKTVTCQFKR